MVGYSLGSITQLDCSRQSHLSLLSSFLGFNMLPSASRRHCLTSLATKPGVSAGSCRALKTSQVRPLLQPFIIHQSLSFSLSSSSSSTLRQYSTSPKLQISSELKMAAQQNNEMFKLSELFNVKDKGMAFSLSFQLSQMYTLDHSWLTRNFSQLP